MSSKAGFEKLKKFWKEKVKYLSVNLEENYEKIKIIIKINNKIGKTLRT